MEIVLVSGLPRSGKTTFANRIQDSGVGYIHVPLDKYILAVPDNYSFLEWVDKTECIDWNGLDVDLAVLASGNSCLTPAPDWSNGGIRKERSMQTGSRFMPSPEIGVVIAGCHAIKAPFVRSRVKKVFIYAPLDIIAARLGGGANEPTVVLDNNLSPNWRSIEKYQDYCDSIIDGTESLRKQCQCFMEIAGLNPADRSILA